VAIIALGAGMFVGLNTTKSDMLATAQKYTDEQNMFDLRLLSTYGWSKDDVVKISAMDGVQDAEGAISLDVIATSGKAEKESVYRLHAIPERVNKVHLLGGRMPQSPNECLVDGHHANDSVLGEVIRIVDGNEQETLDSLNVREFTVVGYVSTPLYMDMSRGTTSLGNGNLSSYVYIPEDAFSVDYYTEIGITMDGDYENYSDAFTEAMESMADRLKPEVQIVAQDRYISLKSDGEKQYAEGLKEYEEGYAEYEKAKREALDELKSALKKIQDGQTEIDKNWQTVLDGEAQITEAQQALDDSRKNLDDARKELADEKVKTYAQLAQAQSELFANYKAVTEGLTQVQEGLAQINDGIAQLENGLTQIEAGISQINLMLGILQPAMGVTEQLLQVANRVPGTDPAYIAKLEEQLSSQKARIDEYVRQKETLLQTQDECEAQFQDLQTQKSELLTKEEELTTALPQINAGMVQLENSQLQAQNQFAAAEAQLESAQIQWEAGQRELETKKQELAEGRVELEKAQAELEAGMAEYEQGKLEAEAELAKAEAELLDAKKTLQDARNELDGMEEPEVYLLNRNTNPGYLAVNNNSDIVAGVSRVFPAFFLLVAALVCITTLGRMVDDERTQIGVMKALGYKNSAIISKYMWYTGSAAVIGCGLGVVAGSIVFPLVLWKAYGLILNLTPKLALGMNWPLCLIVVGAYTAVSMFVTWYCCRRELREVPAELIRPKAPKPGKKILLEYLPFWNKMDFLNKVMFRNVFRYRQRLLMMLVGICGCTALLLTGFGLRDSIVDIVTVQYDEVTKQDIEVYFSEHQTPEAQENFRDALKNHAQQIHFYHQSSVTLEGEKGNQDINLICSDEGIKDFVDMHKGNEKLEMPRLGETYLSIGVAEKLGIREGDFIHLRNSDMRELNLKVAAIFDNHVHNYAVVCPGTILDQWGQEPKISMAFVNVLEGQDAHAASALISEQENVMNVSVCQDIADQVGGMLKALDLVVVTVVICAGLLAVIVLYNLTNISITERAREIATIKVLGFNSRETAAYVFKENLLLTVMGAVIGIGGGILLLRFVMSQIKIDMVWFTARLSVPSYIFGVLLTLLSAVLVDFLLYFKLEKINMAEALKSVE
jgi:putative ABC transport system permease protein